MPQPYKKDIVEVYIAAIAELYHIQILLGLNNSPNFRGMAIETLLKDLLQKQAQKSREASEDRGAKGLNAGYRSEQFCICRISYSLVPIEAHKAYRPA